MAEGSVLGVIPARYASRRFPGKAIAPICGKPMIQHVYERALKASMLSSVIVATDDLRIKQVVEGFGGRAVMSSPDCPTGTDRVAEVALSVNSAYFVNIQGDEPLIDPSVIDCCARMLLQGCQMCTLATPIETRSELFNQNIVKVVIDENHDALYFSRHAIPFPRYYLDRGIDVDLANRQYLKHIGIYGYTRTVLERLRQAGQCDLERIECLEQLRALHLGIKIRVGIVEADSIPVDVPADVERVERLMEVRERR